MWRRTAAACCVAAGIGLATASVATAKPTPLPAAATATASRPDTCPAAAQGRRIGAIRYTGLNATRPFVVDRARFQQLGHRFSCARYRLEEARLQGLDLFAVIRVTTTPMPQDQLAVTYHFLELPKYIVFPAVRRSDVYGWLVGPAVSFLNFLGRDIRLEAFLRSAVAPKPFVATELLFEASSPWIGRAVPVEYAMRVLRNQAFDAVKLFNESSWNARLSFFHRMTWRFRLIYAAEFTQVSPDPLNPTFDLASNPTPVPVVLNNQGDLVLGLSAGVLWDSRDRRVNPHSGLRFEATVGQYGGVLGGPANYQRVLFDHRSWLHVRWTPSQLTILHLSALARLRPGRMGVYDYYVVGGPNSLRSVAQSSELYGQSEVLGTAELRHELFDRRPFSLFGFHLYAGLQVVAGGDVALLWRPQDALNGPPRVASAVYGGLHVLLPGVDRVRFELGWHRDAQGRWQSGFSVGLFEKSRTQRLRHR